MYFAGTAVLLDVASSLCRGTIRDPDELSHKIFSCETEAQRSVPDIVRLPLKLTFPSLAIKPYDTSLVGVLPQNFCGPSEDESEVAHNSDIGDVSGRCISTYPLITINAPDGTVHQLRDGDPICDRFIATLMPRRQILVVADGCNWGLKPKIAAVNASNTFSEYIRDHHHEVTSTHYAARLISRAFALAHHSIFTGAEDFWELGTTTLLGGLIVELEEPVKDVLPSGEKVENEWAFVWGSVGDCKAFHWSPKTRTFRDITSTNRMCTESAKDCGGRLGPAGKDGSPDLRNFRIDYIPCSTDDIIILLSDGVHDNLEPLHLGFDPKDVGLPDASWETVDPLTRTSTAIVYGEKLLYHMIVHDKPITEPFVKPEDVLPSSSAVFEVTPSRISQVLIDHCVRTNLNAVTFMVENPGKRLPRDYKLFPGKMDHTTCLASRIGVSALTSASAGPSPEHESDS